MLRAKQHYPKRWRLTFEKNTTLIYMQKGPAVVQSSGCGDSFWRWNLDAQMAGQVPV